MPLNHLQRMGRRDSIHGAGILVCWCLLLMIMGGFVVAWTDEVANFYSSGLDVDYVNSLVNVWKDDTKVLKKEVISGSVSFNQEWTCFGLAAQDVSVCNSGGLCVAQDTCSCDDDNYASFDCSKTGSELSNAKSKSKLVCEWDRSLTFDSGFSTPPECVSSPIDPILYSNPRGTVSEDDGMFCSLEDSLFDLRCQFLWYKKEISIEEESYLYEQDLGYGNAEYYKGNVIVRKGKKIAISCYRCLIGKSNGFTGRGVFVFKRDFGSVARIEDPTIPSMLVNDFTFKFYFTMVCNETVTPDCESHFKGRNQTLFEFVTKASWKVFINQDLMLSIHIFPTDYTLTVPKLLKVNSYYYVVIVKSPQSGLTVFINEEKKYQDSKLVEDWDRTKPTPGLSDLIGRSNNDTDPFEGEIENFDLDPRAKDDLELKIESKNVTCYGVNYLNTESVCSGHGSCVSKDNCQCNAPYTGIMCEEIIFTRDCSGNGKFVMETQSCDCNSDYYGWNCDFTIVPEFCVAPEEIKFYNISIVGTSIYLEESIHVISCNSITIGVSRIFIEDSFKFFLKYQMDILDLFRIEQLQDSVFIWVDIDKTLNYIYSIPFLYTYSNGQIKPWFNKEGFLFVPPSNCFKINNSTHAIKSQEINGTSFIEIGEMTFGFPMGFKPYYRYPIFPDIPIGRSLIFKGDNSTIQHVIPLSNNQSDTNLKFIALNVNPNRTVDNATIFTLPKQPTSSISVIVQDDATLIKFLVTVNISGTFIDKIIEPEFKLTRVYQNRFISYKTGTLVFKLKTRIVISEKTGKTYFIPFKQLYDPLYIYILVSSVDLHFKFPPYFQDTSITGKPHLAPPVFEVIPTVSKFSYEVILQDDSDLIIRITPRDVFITKVSITRQFKTIYTNSHDLIHGLTRSVKIDTDIYLLVDRRISTRQVIELYIISLIDYSIRRFDIVPPPSYPSITIYKKLKIGKRIIYLIDDHFTTIISKDPVIDPKWIPLDNSTSNSTDPSYTVDNDDDLIIYHKTEELPLLIIEIEIIHHNSSIVKKQDRIVINTNQNSSLIHDWKLIYLHPLVVIIDIFDPLGIIYFVDPKNNTEIVQLDKPTIVIDNIKHRDNHTIIIFDDDDKILIIGNDTGIEIVNEYPIPAIHLFTLTGNNTIEKKVITDDSDGNIPCPEGSFGYNCLEHSENKNETMFPVWYIRPSTIPTLIVNYSNIEMEIEIPGIKIPPFIRRRFTEDKDLLHNFISVSFNTSDWFIVYIAVRREITGTGRDEVKVMDLRDKKVIANIRVGKPIDIWKVVNVQIELRIVIAIVKEPYRLYKITEFNVEMITGIAPSYIPFGYPQTWVLNREKDIRTIITSKIRNEYVVTNVAMSYDFDNVTVEKVNTIPVTEDAFPRIYIPGDPLNYFISFIPYLRVEEIDYNNTLKVIKTDDNINVEDSHYQIFFYQRVVVVLIRGSEFRISLDDFRITETGRNLIPDFEENLFGKEIQCTDGYYGEDCKYSNGEEIITLIGDPYFYENNVYRNISQFNSTDSSIQVQTVYFLNGQEIHITNHSKFLVKDCSLVDSETILLFDKSLSNNSHYFMIKYKKVDGHYVEDVFISIKPKTRRISRNVRVVIIATKEWVLVDRIGDEMIYFILQIESGAIYPIRMVPNNQNIVNWLTTPSTNESCTQLFVKNYSNSTLVTTLVSISASRDIIASENNFYFDEITFYGYENVSLITTNFPLIYILVETDEFLYLYEAFINSTRTLLIGRETLKFISIHNRDWEIIDDHQLLVIDKGELLLIQTNTSALANISLNDDNSLLIDDDFDEEIERITIHGVPFIDGDNISIIETNNENGKHLQRNISLIHKISLSPDMKISESPLSIPFRAEILLLFYQPNNSFSIKFEKETDFIYRETMMIKFKPRVSLSSSFKVIHLDEEIWFGMDYFKTNISYFRISKEEVVRYGESISLEDFGFTPIGLAYLHSITIRKGTDFMNYVASVSNSSVNVLTVSGGRSKLLSKSIRNLNIVAELDSIVKVICDRTGTNLYLLVISHGIQDTSFIELFRFTDEQLVQHFIFESSVISIQKDREPTSKWFIIGRTGIIVLDLDQIQNPLIWFEVLKIDGTPGWKEDDDEIIYYEPVIDDTPMGNNLTIANNTIISNTSMVSNETEHGYENCTLPALSNSTDTRVNRTDYNQTTTISQNNTIEEHLNNSTHSNITDYSNKNISNTAYLHNSTLGQENTTFIELNKTISGNNVTSVNNTTTENTISNTTISINQTGEGIGNNRTSDSNSSANTTHINDMINNNNTVDGFSNNTVARENNTISEKNVTNIKNSTYSLNTNTTFIELNVTNIKNNTENIFTNITISVNQTHGGLTNNGTVERNNSSTLNVTVHGSSNNSVPIAHIPVITCFGKQSYDNMTCSSNGVCISNDTCQCLSGYVGIMCEIPICFGLNATIDNVCNGNGKCIDLDLCDCEDGFSGTKCQFKTFVETQCSGSFVKSYDFVIVNQDLMYESVLTDQQCGKSIVIGRLNITSIPFNIINSTSKTEIISSLISTYNDGFGNLYISFHNSLQILSSNEDELFFKVIDLNLFQERVLQLPISNIDDLEYSKIATPHIFGQVRIVNVHGDLFGLTISSAGDVVAFSILADHAVFLAASSSITTYSLLSKGNVIYSQNKTAHSKYIFITSVGTASLITLGSEQTNFTGLAAPVPSDNSFSILISNPDNGKQFWFTLSTDGVNVSSIVPNIEAEKASFVYLASDKDFTATNEKELKVETSAEYTIISNIVTGMSLRVENIMLQEVSNIFDVSMDKSTSASYFSISDSTTEKKLQIDNISSRIIPTYEPMVFAIYGWLDLPNTQLELNLKYREESIASFKVVKTGTNEYSTLIQSIQLSHDLESVGSFEVNSEIIIRDNTYSTSTFIPIPFKISMYNRVRVVDIIPKVAFKGENVFVQGSFYPSNRLSARISYSSQSAVTIDVEAQYVNSTFALLVVPDLVGEVNIQVNIQIMIQDMNIITTTNDQSILFYVDPEITVGKYSLDQFVVENIYNISGITGSPLISKIPSSMLKSSLLFKLDKSYCNANTSSEITQVMTSSTIYDLSKQTILDMRFLGLNEMTKGSIMQLWFVKQHYTISIDLQIDQNMRTLVLKLPNEQSVQTSCDVQENTHYQIISQVQNGEIQIKIYDIELSLTLCSVKQEFSSGSLDSYGMAFGQSIDCETLTRSNSSDLIALQILASYQKCASCSLKTTSIPSSIDSSMIAGLSAAGVILLMTILIVALISFIVNRIRKRRMRSNFVYYDKSNEGAQETLADLFNTLDGLSSNETSEMTTNETFENDSDVSLYNAWV